MYDVEKYVEGVGRYCFRMVRHGTEFSVRKPMVVCRIGQHAVITGKPNQTFDVEACFEVSESRLASMERDETINCVDMWIDDMRVASRYLIKDRNRSNCWKAIISEGKSALDNRYHHFQFNLNRNVDESCQNLDSPIDVGAIRVTFLRAEPDPSRPNRGDVENVLDENDGVVAVAQRAWMDPILGIDLNGPKVALNEANERCRAIPVKQVFCDLQTELEVRFCNESVFSRLIQKFELYGALGNVSRAHDRRIIERIHEYQQQQQLEELESIRSEESEDLRSTQFEDEFEWSPTEIVFHETHESVTERFQRRVNERAKRQRDELEYEPE